MLNGDGCPCRMEKVFVQKHWRATLERIEKFISDTYFTDANLRGRYTQYMRMFKLFYWYNLYALYKAYNAQTLLISVQGLYRGGTPGHIHPLKFDNYMYIKHQYNIYEYSFTFYIENYCQIINNKTKGKQSKLRTCTHVYMLRNI